MTLLLVYWSIGMLQMIMGDGGVKILWAQITAVNQRARVEIIYLYPGIQVGFSIEFMKSRSFSSRIM